MNGTMRPFRMRGVVVHGYGRGGSQLGYPTANIELDDATIALLNEYKGLVICGFGCVESDASSADSDDITRATCGPFPLAMSVGHNPQFKNKELSAEVHFLHTFEKDFYGSVIRIIALDQVRVQSAFNSLDELIAAIDGDVEKSHKCLAQQKYVHYKQDRFVNPHAALTESENSLPYFSWV